MAVSLSYDATLSRVLIDADGLAAADYATVERSTDQITWTTVRGGSEIVDLTAGAFDVGLVDYEFAPDVPNYYRIRGVETGAITFVAAGAAASGNNTSLVPALPAGIVVGDLLIILAAIRNSGTGTVNVPTGWTLMRQYGNLSYLGRRYESGDAAPTVTFTGGVAGADTLARMAAFRRAELVPVTGVDQLNASAQNIASPALTVPADDLVIVEGTWKQDDYSSNDARTAPAAFTSIGGVVSTAGDDAAMSWWYLIQTTAADLGTFDHTVVGGAAAISRASVIALEHAAYLNSQTASITPTITSAWLKSVARPFLNLAVDVVSSSRFPVTRPARTGVFDVIGRTMPVAVNDVRKSRRWVMQVRTETADDRDNVALLLASGDVLLVQAPAACDVGIVPTGYVTVGDYDQEIHPLRPLSVLHTLPCAEVAEPSPDVVAATQTWATVLATYATWSDVIAAHPDWADLLTLIGDPSEVIVP